MIKIILILFATNCAKNLRELKFVIKGKNENLIKYCKKGNKEKVIKLLDNKADINFKDDEGNTALFYAFQGHKERKELKCLEDDTYESSSSNESEENVNLKTKKNHKKIVKLLINKGSEVNLKNSKGTSALFQAISLGWIDVVSLILDHGADFNFKTQKGKSALLLAILKSRPKIVKLLIEKGADINKQDIYKENI